MKRLVGVLFIVAFAVTLIGSPSRLTRRRPPTTLETHTPRREENQMPELMRPYYTEVIAEQLGEFPDISRIDIDNAIQAVIENRIAEDGYAPDLENSQDWDDVEYRVIDRLGVDFDVVKRY